MQCLCRNCGKEYDERKARGEWRGFCSAKCQHDKAKRLGHRRHSVNYVYRTEYDVLKAHGCIGDVPTDIEKSKLQEELDGLLKAKEYSLYVSERRIIELRRLITAHL